MEHGEWKGARAVKGKDGGGRTFISRRGRNWVWKTKRIVEENVSRFSRSPFLYLSLSPLLLEFVEKKEKSRGLSNDEGGVRIAEKVGKRWRTCEEGTQRERERQRIDRECRRNDLVGLSWTSFIFSSRLNIKDNLIIEGFPKASRLFVLSRSSFPRASFYPLYPSTLEPSRKTDRSTINGTKS